ncbi:MAG: hypothetical protein R3F41_00875 [Gammaproteobacteria bacterium]|nr:hypothetical protein [Pseudomonadales bacterium]
MQERTVILLFILGVVFLLGYTGRDDSHITYFVSQSLADGKGLVNFNGENVEQSSSLLFTVLLAALSWLTRVDAATLGPLLSLSLLIATFFLTNSLFRGSAFAKAGSHTLGAACLCIPVLYWSLSGMENTLYILLIFSFLKAFLVVRFTNRGLGLLAISLVTGLLHLTRPEFIFVAVAALTMHSVWSRKPESEALPLILSVVPGIATAIALRFLLGLDFFPNTVFAKQSSPDFLQQAVSGIKYLGVTFHYAPVSSLIATVSLVWAIILVHSRKLDPRMESFFKLAISLVTALVLFAVASGGDWMEEGRFLTAPLFLAFLLGLIALPVHLLDRRIILILLAGLSYDAYSVARYPFGGLPWIRPYAYVAGNFSPSPLEKFNVFHARDLSFVDRTIGYLDQPLIGTVPIVTASIQAGMIPYYLKQQLGDRFYFVDLAGLSTAHFRNCNEKLEWGNDAYNNITEIQNCIGLKFDFIYDLDNSTWTRLEALKSVGCREIFREDLIIGARALWKRPLPGRQFLVDCRKS